MNNPTAPLLSICMATFKRGNYIGQTLSTVLSQLTPEVEVIVYDGNSPDNTEQVVTELCSKYPSLRYYKAKTNGGIDQDFDAAVSLAKGKYCWLMTDDDLVAPGAILKILNRLANTPALLVLNASVYDREFETLLLDRFINTSNDRDFEPNRFEYFFALTGACLSFIGSVVILKEEWDSRDRNKYYGSLFVHFGVIFQKPFARPLAVISEPLIKIRYGNAMWTSRGFEIWMVKWPDLVHSFERFSLAARNAVCPNTGSRTVKYLLYYRGMAIYGPEEYQKHMKARLNAQLKLIALVVAYFPRVILTNLLAIYFAFINRQNKLGFYDLVLSKGSTRFSRWLASRMAFGDKKWLS